MVFAEKADPNLPEYGLHHPAIYAILMAAQNDAPDLEHSELAERIMNHDDSVHVLFLAHGRRTMSRHKATRVVLNEVQDAYARRDAPLVICTLVTSRKDAILVGRQNPPGIVMTEFERWEERLEFCKEVMHRWPGVPMIAVTNSSIEESTVRFDLVIPSPLSTPSLLGALEQTLGATPSDRLVQVGEVTLDKLNRTVISPKGEYHITPKQCALLEMLMLRNGEVVTRGEIMQEIWQTNFLGDTRTLDVHIRWLREQIEYDASNPKYLVTVRGKGYRFRTR
jgi:DNA-binding response OmpR family regulator